MLIIKYSSVLCKIIESCVSTTADFFFLAWSSVRQATLRKSFSVLHLPFIKGLVQVFDNDLRYNRSLFAQLNFESENTNVKIFSFKIICISDKKFNDNYYPINYNKEVVIHFMLLMQIHMHKLWYLKILPRKINLSIFPKIRTYSTSYCVR